ncbi:hypothetical protein T12_4055 [Trichinella patagoniensis]|uniref:Uncharacterized protein n=1 Tax=Trichinella patagoniensis TaxID=990121 RepID=A0A0V0ZHS0_9BILA|nr:hypothetical protein T12_4055 [Trichinella patagoniensis]
MQIFICPKATPQAMPQAIFRKFRNFSNIAPGFALRLRPRANKNLHIPSGYASGVLLHHICPQGYASGYASGNFSKISKFSNIAPGFALRLPPRAMKNLHITLRA